MPRRILVILLLLSGACGSSRSPELIPTIAAIPTLTALPSPNPTTTLLPQVVGVPTPTPPYADLGLFISRLTPGEKVTGAITGAALSHIYTFDGAAGQYVTVEMLRVSGTVDPVVTLYDPVGDPVATDDNSGGNRTALLRNIVLVEDGVYSLQATGDGFTGDYQLSLHTGLEPQPVTPVVVTQVPTDTPLLILVTPTIARAVPGNRLEDHVPVLGFLDRPGDLDRYPLVAAEGEVLTIGVTPTESSRLRPQIEILGPVGAIVATSRSSAANAGGDALLTAFEMPTSGTYSVLVTGENNTVGEYTISYGRGSSRRDIMRPVALPDGANSGEITRRGYRDVWTAFLSADDVITVAVSATDDLLDPVLELVAPDGTVIGEDDNSGSGRNPLLSQMTIRETGLYQIRVRGAGAATLGRYTLVWRYVNRAPTITPPPGTVLLLSVDDFAPDNAYRFYPFQGEAGQRVQIRVVARPGSGFDPVAVLLGPDGTIIAEGDDDGDDLNPRFTVELPTDGTYTVRINGYLSGGPFDLTVNALF